MISSGAALALSFLAIQEAASESPQSSLPLVAELHLRFGGSESRGAGYGFRIASPRGDVWTVASFAAALEPDGVAVIEFEDRIEECGFGEKPASADLVRRATAGQDLWWSDLLLFENVAGQETETLKVRLGPLDIHESFTWVHPELMASADLPLRLVTQEPTWLEFLAPDIPESSSVPGTLVLDRAGLAVAMVSSIEPAGGDQPATLLAQRIDSLAGLPPPLRGQAVRLPHDSRGFDRATLSPTGQLLTWSQVLGGLRAGQLGSTGELAEFAPLRRSTAAAYDPSGLFLAVALGARVEVLAAASLEPLQSFDSLPFPPNRLAWSLDGSSVAAASTSRPGTLICELSSSAVIPITTPPTSALSTGPPGGFLHGTLDGELRLLTPAAASPSVAQEFGHPITALLSTSPSGSFAAGYGNWISSYSAPGQPASWTQSTGSGQTRVLLHFEEQLWAATGSLVEEAGGTFAEDAFLRVFQSDTGQELRRSHHFDDLPCALFLRNRQLLSLTESKELWSWPISNPPRPSR